MERATRDEDGELTHKLEEFVRLRKRLETEMSLSGAQLLTAFVASAFSIGFLGFVSLLFVGSIFGTIVASIISTIAITSMLENMGNRNVDDFLEV